MLNNVYTYFHETKSLLNGFKLEQIPDSTENLCEPIKQNLPLSLAADSSEDDSFLPATPKPKIAKRRGRPHKNISHVQNEAKQQNMTDFQTPGNSGIHCQSQQARLKSISDTEQIVGKNSRKRTNSEDQDLKKCQVDSTTMAPKHYSTVANTTGIMAEEFTSTRLLAEKADCVIPVSTQDYIESQMQGLTQSSGEPSCDSLAVTRLTTNDGCSVRTASEEKEEDAKFGRTTNPFISDCTITSTDVQSHLTVAKLNRNTSVMAADMEITHLTHETQDGPSMDNTCSQPAAKRRRLQNETLEKLVLTRFSLFPALANGTVKSGKNNIQLFLDDKIHTGSINADGSIELKGQTIASIGHWIKIVGGRYFCSLKKSTRNSLRIEYKGQCLGHVLSQMESENVNKQNNTTCPPSVKNQKISNEKPTCPTFGLPSELKTTYDEVSCTDPSPSVVRISSGKLANFSTVKVPETSVGGMTADSKQNSRVVSDDIALHITKIFVHTTSEYIHPTCQCFEDLWNGQKQLPKHLLDELDKW